MDEMPFFRERMFIAAGGAGILAAMALLDYLQHPDNPTRMKEYVFLLYTTLAAVAYGSRRRTPGTVRDERPRPTASP